MSFSTPPETKKLGNEVKRLVNVVLDKLVLKYKSVSEKQFEQIVSKITAQQIFVPNTPIFLKVGLAIDKYHQNIHIGFGEGAVHIGWKHNAARQNNLGYDMRIEFNPYKFSRQEFHEDRVDKLYDVVFKNINTVLGAYHSKTILAFDLAFDIPKKMSEIIVVSLTGKGLNRVKGTLYFGSRSETGHLKIYDKKKERLNAFKKQYRKKVKERTATSTDLETLIDLEESSDLTRIEHTSYFGSDGLNLMFLDKRTRIRNINEEYAISFLDTSELTAEVKSCVLCYQRGEVELREFKRAMKSKIKEVVKEMEQLDLDSIATTSWPSIVDEITKYIRV